VTAEIIEFPKPGYHDPLVSSVARLEQIVREVDRLAVDSLATDQPADGLDHLLAVIERLGDQVVDLAYLLLDEDAKWTVQSAFTSLSDKIAETRAAFDAFDGRKNP
jgi:hypothetical protein